MSHRRLLAKFLTVSLLLASAHTATAAPASALSRGHTRLLRQTAASSSTPVAAEPEQSGEKLPAGISTTALPAETVTVAFTVKGTTVEQYQQRYQLTVATVTGRLAGTPFDQWQFNGDTTSTGDLNVTLSLLAANPGIVVYRLTKATELGAALSGACSTEYCLRLAATRVPADLASINVAPDINKILDKINTVQAQEAQQKRQQYIGTVVGAVVGSVVGVALLAFITYRLYSQMKARQAAELAAAKLEAEEKAKKQQEEFALWASQVLGPNPQAAVAATGVRPGFMTPMYPLTALPTRSNTMFRSQAVTPSLVPNAEQLQVDAAELNQALTQYYAAMQHVQMLLTPKVTPKATPLQTPKVQSPRHSRSNSSSALPPAKDLPTSPHPHDLI